MEAVGVDLWGNAMTWLHLPIGQQLVLRTFDERECSWRLPMLIRAAEIWEAERRQAHRRFRPPKPKGKKRRRIH